MTEDKHRESTAEIVAKLLDIERRYPGRHPEKIRVVRRELGISEELFEARLNRAIDTDEASRVDPILTRRLREARARHYAGRAPLLRGGASSDQIMRGSRSVDLPESEGKKS